MSSKYFILEYSTGEKLEYRASVYDTNREVSKYATKFFYSQGKLKKFPEWVIVSDKHKYWMGDDPPIQESFKYELKCKKAINVDCKFVERYSILPDDWETSS